MPANRWDEVLQYKVTLCELGHTIHAELNQISDTIENEEDLYNSLTVAIGLLEVAKTEIFLAKFKFEGRFPING